LGILLEWLPAFRAKIHLVQVWPDVLEKAVLHRDVNLAGEVIEDSCEDTGNPVLVRDVEPRAGHGKDVGPEIHKEGRRDGAVFQCFDVQPSRRGRSSGAPGQAADADEIPEQVAQRQLHEVLLPALRGCVDDAQTREQVVKLPRKNSSPSGAGWDTDPPDSLTR